MTHEAVSKEESEPPKSVVALWFPFKPPRKGERERERERERGGPGRFIWIGLVGFVGFFVLFFFIWFIVL